MSTENALFFGERIHGVGNAVGVGGVGVGDVGDLLAYRQEWEPFIEGHLELWRFVNKVLEDIAPERKCPSGIFSESDIANMGAVDRTVCSYLLWSRIYTSNTNPLGILPQWNAWVGRSSAEIMNGADSMLQWHQNVVMTVGGPIKNRLELINETLKLELSLPDVPEFTLQQQIIARIEAAYIKAKGVLQVIGYGASDVLIEVGSAAEATAEGLSDIARSARDAAAAVPKAVPWIGAVAVVSVAVVGGALIVYYKPRQRTS